MKNQIPRLAIEPAGVRTGFLLTAVVAAFVLVFSTQADRSWSQFRGPNATGISTEPGIPSTWSESSHLQWKAPLPGPGSSSPIIVGDRVFVTCYSGYGVDSDDPGQPENLKRHLICLRLADGTQEWSVEVSARLPEDPYRGFITEHGYASSTAVSDGERVYVFFGKTGLLAYDLEGKRLWQRDLGQESSNRRWGSAASPIVYKDLLIINASEESQSVRALNKKTGDEVWKAEASSLELSYGTPVIASGPGGRDDIVLSVPGEIWGLNPATGRLVWYAESGLPGNISPTVSIHDGIVISFGGYPSTGAVAVRAGGQGDVTQSHVLWKSRNGSYIPSAVTRGRYLYWVNDTGEAFCAITETGKLVYRERLEGLTGRGRSKAIYASAVRVEDRIFVVSRRSGTFVLAAEPEFKLIAHNHIAGDETDFNGTPAIAAGRILLRSNQSLYCIGQTAD